MVEHSQKILQAMSLKALYCNDYIICQVLKLRDISEVHRLTAGQKMPKGIFSLDPVFRNQKFRKDRETELLIVYGDWLSGTLVLTDQQLLAVELELCIDKVEENIEKYIHTLQIMMTRLPEQSKNWLVLMKTLALSNEENVPFMKCMHTLCLLMESYQRYGESVHREKPVAFSQTNQLLRGLIIGFSRDVNDHHNAWSLVHEWFVGMVDSILLLADMERMNLLQTWFYEILPIKVGGYLSICFGLNGEKPLSYEALAKQLALRVKSGRMRIDKVKSVLDSALVLLGSEESLDRLDEILFHQHMDEEFLLNLDQRPTVKSLAEMQKYRQQLLIQPSSN